MDVRQYKRRTLALRGWPGTGQNYGLLALSYAAIDRALGRTAALALRFGDRIGSLLGDLTGQIEILIQAVVSAAYPHDPLLTIRSAMSLTPAVVDTVFNDWADVQRQAMPDPDAIERELVKAMRTDGQLVADAACALEESPTSYYGEPVDKLTDGQIAYFFGLRSAFRRVHGDEKPGTTCISNEWLEGRL